MKKYLLFAGDNYYPMGGFDDFRGDFDTIELAEQHLKACFSDVDWAHIVDRDTRVIIKKYNQYELQ